jgi:nucleotide-binding universal stress UspA family protein
MNTTNDKSSSEAPAAAHLKHILVPVDFSKPCLQGLAAALALGRHYGAKLTLVHVVKHLPRGSHVVMDLVGIEQDWRRPARERLAEFVAAHIPNDVPVSQVVAVGKPFHEIVKLAVEIECDLIVISTHGYTALAHVLIGSNAERIVRHAPCSVFVVRGIPHESNVPGGDAPTFRWILLPTDFSENSRRSFPLATAMAREFKAKMTLAYVQPALGVSVGMMGETPWIPNQAESAAQRADAQNRLNKIRAEHFGADLNIDTLVLDGVPHQSLCAAANSVDPGLIVMATRGATGWEHALLGSVTERVVRHAPCPVLVAR